MSDQLRLPGLDSIAPDRPPGAAVAPLEAVGSDLVPRSPGWTLLADPDVATNLWHVIASRRYDGVLVAVCGATGRFIDEAEREIIKCSPCEAATAPPP